MTKEFDERNMAKSRRVCEAMAEAAHVTKWLKLTERERQILAMWPRFEDGEPVMLGDKYEDNEGHECFASEVHLDIDGPILVDSEGFHDLYRKGKRVKRPVPKVLDADGVEIEVGDTVWYRGLCTMGSMRKATVIGFDENSLGGKLVTLKDEAGKTWYIGPKKITHVQPDSWERFVEDMQKSTCAYFGYQHKECDEGDGCPARGALDCSNRKMADLIRRAKALAGVEVEA